MRFVLAPGTKILKGGLNSDFWGTGLYCGTFILTLTVGTGKSGLTCEVGLRSGVGPITFAGFHCMYMAKRRG